MNNAYDESGFVVATHPIQEAQHDGVTVIGLAANNAPELLPCPFCGEEAYSSYHQNDGDYWAVHCTICYASVISRYRNTGLDSPTKAHVEKAWNTRAVMQPQVSESDEVSNLASHYLRGFAAGVESARQPATVSADAVECAHNIAVLMDLPWTPEAERQAATIIQAFANQHRDACRLDGARKMQQGLAEHFQKNGCEKVAAAIRALSPETVCGGE